MDTTIIIINIKSINMNYNDYYKIRKGILDILESTSELDRMQDALVRGAVEQLNGVVDEIDEDFPEYSDRFNEELKHSD